MYKFNLGDKTRDSILVPLYDFSDIGIGINVWHLMNNFLFIPPTSALVDTLHMYMKSIKLNER